MNIALTNKTKDYLRNRARLPRLGLVHGARKTKGQTFQQLLILKY